MNTSTVSLSLIFRAALIAIATFIAIFYLAATAFAYPKGGDQGHGHSYGTNTGGYYRGQ